MAHRRLQFYLVVRLMIPEPVTGLYQTTTARSILSSNAPMKWGDTRWPPVHSKAARPRQEPGSRTPYLHCESRFRALAPDRSESSRTFRTLAFEKPYSFRTELRTSDQPCHRGQRIRVARECLRIRVTSLAAVSAIQE